MPDATTLAGVLLSNLWGFLLTPSMFCLFPPLGGLASHPGVLLGICLSVAILAGAIRQARRQGWTAIHFLLPFYLAILLAWNYAPPLDRALVLFLPMFYAGLWTEVRHLTTVLARDWRPGGATRVPVAALGGGLALILIIAALHYASDGRSPLTAQAEYRSALAADKAALYDWVRRSTAAETRFVAYEDALLYLHTGRQAMWPIAFRPTGSLHSAMREQDLARLGDVARAIGAGYWVVAEDDFPFDQERDTYRQRTEQLLAAQPVVFRSPAGRVQVYDLAGWAEAGAQIR